MKFSRAALYVLIACASARVSGAPESGLILAADSSCDGQTSCGGWRYTYPSDDRVFLVDGAIFKLGSKIAAQETLQVCDLPVEPETYSSCMDGDVRKTRAVPKSELDWPSAGAVYQLEWEPPTHGTRVDSGEPITLIASDIKDYLITYWAADARGRRTGRSSEVIVNAPATSYTLNAGAVRTCFTVTARTAVASAEPSATACIDPAVAPGIKPLPAREVAVRTTSVAPEPPDPSGRTLKWHPGHYMFLDRNDSSESIRAEHFRQIDAIANEPTVRGIKLAVYWRYLEGPTMGDYSPGFALIDEYLAHLAPIGKQFILSVQDRAFGSYDPDLTTYFPSYIVTGAQFGTTKMDNGVTTRIWQQATNDRLIALSSALAARYDKHPNFEIYQSGETAVSAPLGQDGYTYDALGEQIRRLVQASRAAWHTTAVRLAANYFSDDAAMESLIADVYDDHAAVGGPDVLPDETIQADRVWMGQTGERDYRGDGHWVAEVQSPSLGGHEGTYTPQELYENGMLRHPSHFVWYRNTWSGGDAQKWDTGILPFIKSVNGATYSTCPSYYAGACTSISKQRPPSKHRGDNKRKDKRK